MSESLNQVIAWAIEKCNLANVGYSQPYRNEKTINGITYYDCSSFVWYALKSGGFDVNAAYQQATGNPYSGNAITTANLRSFLTALGFTHENINGEWKQGDILWRSGHTEIVYQGGTGQGKTMGAHSANYPLERQVSINTTVSTAASWSDLYRSPVSGGDVTGSSAYVVAAICGNMWQESGINPGVWENLQVASFSDLYHGYGLGQWTNVVAGGRLSQLKSYLDNNNYAADDGTGQLHFLIHEDYWTHRSEYSEFNSLSDFLHSASTDITRLTHAYNLCWEGIHDSSWDDRVDYANNCYDYILAHWNDQNQWIKGNRYLTEAERYNNCVILYQFFNGEEPEPEKKKKMKLFLYMRRRGLLK